MPIFLFELFAGEEDMHAYDITRLQLPDYERDSMRKPQLPPSQPSTQPPTQEHTLERGESDILVIVVVVLLLFLL